MRFLVRPHQLPARLSAGLVILNSGLGKREADQPTAEGVHGMAAGTYPFLKSQDPQRFVRLLSTGEIAIGTMLLTPFVPSLVAGAALTAFAGGLLGLYLRTPGMREEGGLRPTSEGLPLVKDVWLLGIGLTLALDDVRDR
ncbi:hypothetical protein [Actinocorallia populi]|uniref:hypothetical protein n=1 Tax=Actinocorallia populi TaxID=2079200 RepID=UPI000D089B14|nr:hypothetical protein [Actinocorallia populi]